MKKIEVKRSHPKSKSDFSQEAQIIEKEPEPEFDHTKWSLKRFMELSERYNQSLSELVSLHGKIADLNQEHAFAIKYVEWNEEDQEEDNDDDE